MERRHLLILVGLFLLSVLLGAGILFLSRNVFVEDVDQDGLGWIKTLNKRKIEIVQIVNEGLIKGEKILQQQLHERGNTQDQTSSTSREQVKYRIGIISDSHGATENIDDALAEMAAEEVSLIIHLGDFTPGGEEYFFIEAKGVLEVAGIPYLVMPGDHDFNWVPEHSRRNFEQVFGRAYSRRYSLDKLQLILYENSSDLLGDYRLKWLESELNTMNLTNQDTEMVLFLSPRPLYSPYFPDKADPEGEKVISLLAENGIKYTFAGNTHTFAKYQDLDQKIQILTVGAIGEYKNPLPQWVLVLIYEDLSVEVIPRPLVRF